MIEVIKNVPSLLVFWDYDYNNYLNISTTRVTSRQQVRWLCPNCQHNWEASVYQTYLQSQKTKDFCPCCQLGKILVKDKNSILTVFPEIVNYLNFSRTNKELLLESLQGEIFTSKLILNYTCPTCRWSWRDYAMSSRLFQDQDKKLYHKNCNEFSSSYYYKEVYPNLSKIYCNKTNEIPFEELKLNHNTTIPIKWCCDKCYNQYNLSLEGMLKRIMRSGSYCHSCHATFKDVVNKQTEVAPLTFLTPELAEEWSNKNSISVYQVDKLSDLEIEWSCSTCKGVYYCRVYERDKHSCPYCNDYELLKDFNSLNVTHPYLANFWSSNNPGELQDYWQYDKRLLNWRCPCCQIDFQCSALEMVSRTTIENQNFQTCPNNCDWIKEIFNNDFLADYPTLLEEWSDRNQIPVQLATTFIETQKYWWRCKKCQGEYQCSIPIRKETELCCPYCSNEQPLEGYNTLMDVYPELAKVWDSNNKFKTNQIIPSVTEKRMMQWHCNTCQYDFEERLNVILKRYLSSEKPNLENICPNCTEIQEFSKINSFLKDHPELENEWEALNNILMPNPKSLTVDSKIRVWWICQENNEHRYKMSIQDRIKCKTRSKQPCIICKGLRRKREHFVPFSKFI